MSVLEDPPEPSKAALGSAPRRSSQHKAPFVVTAECHSLKIFSGGMTEKMESTVQWGIERSAMTYKQRYYG